MISKRAQSHVRSFDDLLDAVQAGQETPVWIVIGEAEAEQLRRGVVPESVQAQARMACDTEWTTATAIARQAS